MTTTENVVYRTYTDEHPAIRYRSLPSRCTGAAETLAEARVSYRTELTGLLDVERYALPPVVEHVEARVAGIWVRSKVGAVHRDRLSDRMFLQRLLESGSLQDELRAYLGDAAGRGVEPVVVLTEPEDPVASVLDQMTPGDAVVATYPDAHEGLGWAAIHGPQAAGFDELPVAQFDSGLRDVPIEAFAQTCLATHRQRAVRVGPYALAQAS
ncbi:MAG: hypothetical protein ABWY45_26915 [Mycobacterium sp.]